MEIDRIIEAKIRERQEEQRKEILIEIRHELGKSLEG
jgi:hypothetical protein